jgi:diguanylate cyclase (GGDEF)-like protein
MSLVPHRGSLSLDFRLIPIAGMDFYGEARILKRLISGHWHGLRILTVALGAAVFVLAVTVPLIGWRLGIPDAHGALAQHPTGMKPNAVLGIGSLGLALVLSQVGGPIRLWRLLPAGIAALIGAVTLAEYGFAWDAGIDQLLNFRSPPSMSVFPGRPAFLTAMMLLLLGLGLLGTEFRGWRHVRATCALVSLLITWTLLNTFLFGHAAAVASRLTIGSISGQDAAALLLVALGTLASQPGSWPIHTVFAAGLGGTVCRWLIPVAVLAPPLLGWVLVDPSAIDTPHAALSWALYSVFSSAGSTGLILLLARRIDILDAERSAATLMSRRDALTGLSNRRAFDSFLLESYNRARRYGRPLTLLTADIDHFKSYNDSFGHPAGDQALQAVAEVLRDVARDTDLVARIGGEEFAILLPETNAIGARVLAERMRSRVADLSLRRTLTISIGIATLSHATPTSAALLEASDAALYAAKRSGRNRVMVDETLFARAL